jgi:hypothetical protein
MNISSRLLSSVTDDNGKVRAPYHTVITPVTLDRFYCYGKPLIIFNQHTMRTEINTDIAAFAPLVKYLESYLGVLAFLLFYSVLNLCLLGQHKNPTSHAIS